MGEEEAHDVPVSADSDRDPVAEFYRRADALYRCAVECCRQHERRAKLVERGALGAELRAAQMLVEACDESLAQLAGCYERAAGRAHPPKENACWRAANGLWMASREYCRRRDGSDKIATRLKKHGAEQFSEINVEYELEMSARLGMKQALKGYEGIRPEAV